MNMLRVGVSPGGEGGSPRLENLETVSIAAEEDESENLIKGIDKGNASDARSEGERL